MLVRPEKPGDHAAVYEINKLAFGQPGEADLVDSLRPVADPQISLVAVEGNRVVGHIFFSPVTVDHQDVKAMGLAPMAVLPDKQRQGVGSVLVRAGLEECRRIGRPIILVVGHPDYYPRFGFVPAKKYNLRFEQEVPEAAFMVAELEPASLAGITGVVRFLPEFSKAS